MSDSALDKVFDVLPEIAFWSSVRGLGETTAIHALSNWWILMSSRV
jgi:hypothetical protein